MTNPISTLLTQREEKKKPTKRQLAAWARLRTRHGPGTPRWSGDAVGVGGAHQWLRKHHNHEKKKCDECGDTKNLQFAKKKGHKYTRNIEDYRVLCCRCHVKYDSGHKFKKPKNCQMCGKSFLPVQIRRKHCSLSCAARWKWKANRKKMLNGTRSRVSQAPTNRCIWCKATKTSTIKCKNNNSRHYFGRKAPFLTLLSQAKKEIK